MHTKLRRLAFSATPATVLVSQRQLLRDGGTRADSELNSIPGFVWVTTTVSSLSSGWCVAGGGGASREPEGPGVA